MGTFKTITEAQLAVISEYLSEMIAEGYSEKLEISHDGCRNVVLRIDSMGWQECCELFPDGEGGYDRSGYLRE